MSKSIYEEALKELTWLVHDEFDDTPNRPELNASEILDKFKKIKDAFEQAQKQKKLLELYKELTTLYRDRFDYTNSATEIKRLWGKIKELENENYN